MGYFSNLLPSIVGLLLSVVVSLYVVSDFNSQISTL